MENNTKEWILVLGSLTTDKEVGKKLEEIINRKKILKHSEIISYVNRFHQVVYIYSDEDTKAEHKKKMINEGWQAEDAQSIIHVYFSFHDDFTIDKPCSVFEKEVDSCFK